MDTSINFLYLSEEDMLKAGVRDMKGCIDTMQEVFSLMSKGDYRMGGPSGNDHGIKLEFPKESDIPGMPLDGPDKRFLQCPPMSAESFICAALNVTAPTSTTARLVFRVLF